MRLEFNRTNFIHLQSCGRVFRQSIDVDTMADVERPDLGLRAVCFTR